MLEVHISSKELPEMIRLLERMPQATDDNIAEVFEMMLPEIERYAKIDAPVDTGRLRADIGTKFNRRKLEGVVYNTVEYSIYVHEGTHKMRARPYILNAIRNKAEMKMKRELEKNLLKEKRGLI